MEVDRSDRVASSSASASDAVYTFGAFELCTRALELRRNGRALHVTAKSLTALLYLIHHRDRLVPRAELMRMVWPDARVGPGSLSQAIWELRVALGDGLRDVHFIRTRRGAGYRFVAEVGVVGHGAKRPPTQLHTARAPRARGRSKHI